MLHQFNITQDQSYFRIFGARRCGNHALINFIAQNLGSEIILLNNCAIAGNPFFSCQSFERNGQIYTRNDTHGGAAIKLESAAFMAELSRAYAGVKDVFAFFEEQLEPDPALNAERLKLGVFADRSRDILTTRSFLNWLASAIKQHQNYNPHLDPNQLTVEMVAHYSLLIHRWLIHARAVQDKTYSPHVVYYERFFSSAQVRQAFLLGLGVTPIRLDIPRVISGFGGGSSFGELPPTLGLDGQSALQRFKHMPTGSAFDKMRTITESIDDLTAFLAAHPFFGETGST